jgi:hypothetical protein
MAWSFRRIVVLTFTAFVLISFLVFIIWRIRLAGEINRQFASIHAAGKPANSAEADAYYPAVPDQENAAIKMARAFEALANYPDGRSNEVKSLKLLSLTNSFSLEQVELVSGYVDMNSNAMALARAAIEMPHCRYPIDLTMGVETLLPHLTPLKELARLEYYHAYLNPGSATNDIAIMLSEARTLDAEPLIISKLVRMAMINMAVDACERRLNSGVLDEQQLMQLDNQFATVNLTNQMAEGFIGERAMFIRVFRMSWKDIKRYTQSEGDGSSSGANMPSSDSPPMFLKASGIFERDLNFYLQAMQTNISIAETFPKNVTQISNVANQNETTARNNFYFLSAMLLPALNNAVMREAVNLAQVRMTRTALAVERYRLANGHLPASLQDLVPAYLPALPQDPCDGNPLRFQLLDKGYLIYSVGKDGMDNGGVARPPDAKSSDKTPYDIIFRVER